MILKLMLFYDVLHHFQLIEQIAKLATENDCNYIVLKKAIPLTLDMKYFGFSVLEMTENYVIYKLEK